MLRSTLDRGDEIENDFYHLKAQEWAVEPHQAKERILRAIATQDELLTALKWITKSYAHYHGETPLVLDARAAMANATTLTTGQGKE